MAQSEDDPSSPLGLTELLEQADIHKSSLIRVTGAHGLAALLWLCRRGYERVGYLKGGCTQEHPDALIVAHACDEASLNTLLMKGPHVREGGALIFQSPLPAPLSGGDDDHIHGLLASYGYAVERCLHGTRRELHVARRRPHTWRKVA
jgi:hypothetical protein